MKGESQRNRVGGIMEEEEEDASWRHLGSILNVSWKHLGGIHLRFSPLFLSRQILEHVSFHFFVSVC